MQRRLDHDFETKTSIDSLTSVSALDATELPRHRWYHFKEAFSPSFVSHAIQDAQCQKTDLIIDPFSGSGTVALTSALEGYDSMGFEVNPFLVFVSNTKLAYCKPQTLKGQFGNFIEGINQGLPSSLENFSTFTERVESKKWLFNLDVLRAFEGGWQRTITKHKPVREITRLCLIGAAMDVANAIKDGKCLRYRKDWQKRRYGVEDFIVAFTSRFNQTIEDLEISKLDNKTATIYEVDARENMRLDSLHNEFKLCVMSPPYLNSFDYTDVYRPELFLGKFVESNDDLQKLRMRTLRSHVQANWNNPVEDDFGTAYKDSFFAINQRVEKLWNRRIPQMIQAYFEDMKQVLSNLKAVARKDASIWILVSTSSYAGIEIPVDLIIADIGTQLGWCLREVSVVRYLRRVPGQQWSELYETKNRNPYLRESVIILDNKPRGKR